jgi:hypothetical protein
MKPAKVPASHAEFKKAEAEVQSLTQPGPDQPPVLNKEPLVYEELHLSTRSYK